MSWEATCWVMDRSKHKGLNLFVLLVLANDLNAQGVGYGPSVARLGKRLRIDPRTVMRCERRLEKSGELVCLSRGTGQTPTLWQIPGVVSDGFSLGSRGGKLPSQGRRIALPGEAKRPPRAGELPSLSTPLSTNPKSLVSNTSSSPTTIDEPQSVSSGKPVEKVPEELMQVLGAAPYCMDSAGIARLWIECRLQEPGVTVEKILRLAAWKARTAPRVKNLGGLLITVLPDICRHDSLYPRKGSSSPPPQ